MSPEQVAIETMRARCAVDPDFEIACRYIWAGVDDTIRAREPPDLYQQRHIRNKQLKARGVFMIALADNDTPEDAARKALDSVGIYT